MENKKKAKGTVLSLVLSILLVLNLVVCGVAIALSVANVTLGGSITFNAKHVNATISAGQVSGGTLNGTNKMQAITLDATHDGATEIATWSGLDLEFNESGNNVSISFTITNLSEEDCMNVSITSTYDACENIEMTISADGGSAPSSTRLYPNGSGGDNVTYSITFSVIDPNKSGNVTNFAINFSLERVKTHNLNLNVTSDNGDALLPKRAQYAIYEAGNMAHPTLIDINKTESGYETVRFTEDTTIVLFLWWTEDNSDYDGDDYDFTYEAETSLQCWLYDQDSSGAIDIDALENRDEFEYDLFMTIYKNGVKSKDYDCYMPYVNGVCFRYSITESVQLRINFFAGVN